MPTRGKARPDTITSETLRFDFLSVQLSVEQTSVCKPKMIALQQRRQ